MHFGAGHAPAAIDGVLGGAGDRVVEARPAGAALELYLALEQRCIAADAREGAGAVLDEQRATARTLGAVVAHDAVLLGGQALAPLGIGSGHGKSLGVHYCLPS